MDGVLCALAVDEDVEEAASPLAVLSCNGIESTKLP